jgi:hypothetical protein
MRKTLLTAIVLFTTLSAWAGDYLFLNKRYLSLTEAVLKEADAEATRQFAQRPEFATKWDQASNALQSHIDAVQKARLLKKIKPETVSQQNDRAFAEALNAVKDGLNLMASESKKTPTQLFPSYSEWMQVEAAVVKDGLEQRLAAYQTRYGPESEQINIVEFLIGEAFLHGDEGGPAAWEPIARLTPVQATSAGAGLTSTAQLGANYYFVNGVPKGPLSWVVSNHIGLAATLQYLEDPRIFRFRGKPCYGLQLHLDKKEVGLTWDANENTFRATLGYAFQFIPLAL